MFALAARLDLMIQVVPSSPMFICRERNRSSKKLGSSGIETENNNPYSQNHGKEWQALEHIGLNESRARRDQALLKQDHP